MTELGFIGAMLQPVELCPEDLVVKQGDENFSLFFVLKGKLKVSIVDRFSKQLKVMPSLD